MRVPPSLSPLLLAALLCAAAPALAFDLPASMTRVLGYLNSDPQASSNQTKDLAKQLENELARSQREYQERFARQKAGDERTAAAYRSCEAGCADTFWSFVKTVKGKTTENYMSLANAKKAWLQCQKDCVAKYW